MCIFVLINREKGKEFHTKQPPYLAQAKHYTKNIKNILKKSNYKAQQKEHIVNKRTDNSETTIVWACDFRPDITQNKHHSITPQSNMP
jgi:hypothetical protein